MSVKYNMSAKFISNKAAEVDALKFSKCRFFNIADYSSTLQTISIVKLENLAQSEKSQLTLDSRVGGFLGLGKELCQ